MVFAIFFYVGGGVIMGGLVLLYNAFGLTAFFIGVAAVILVCLRIERRRPVYLDEFGPMSGWFADDRPHLAPPVEQVKLDRERTALANRREGGTPTRHHRRG